jgi:hypothetical protein
VIGPRPTNPADERRYHGLHRRLQGGGTVRAAQRGVA